ATPDPLPIDPRIVASISPPPKSVPMSAGPDGDAGAFGPLPPGAVVNVAYRAVEGDAEEVAAQVAFLAGVFDRCIFKITAKGGEKAARGIATSVRDKGVAPNRLVTTSGEPAGAFALVEVLSPP
ncbi:MAG TPA: hypothetical protein VM925_31765, partial [Labilithrix sp.]|nr:hypothetical protein [Labilithrix sp.]